jgi:hypothetical protein
MRIVDRTTFLQMPAGTLYAKFGGEPTEARCYIFGDLCIKDESRIQGAGPIETRGKPIDWHYVQTVPWPEDATDSMKWIDTVDGMLAGGESAPLDFGTLDRDGLFDEGQLFAVFSGEDARRLVARLQQAVASAYAEPAP